MLNIYIYKNIQKTTKQQNVDIVFKYHKTLTSKEGHVTKSYVPIGALTSPLNSFSYLKRAKIFSQSEKWLTKTNSE